MRSPKLVLPLGVLAIVGVVLGGACSRQTGGDTLMLMPENAPGDTGVVRRTDLLVAYTRSARNGARLNDLRARRDRAASAGDQPTVDRFDAYGAAWQEIAHRQLAGDEPLYTVLLGVQDELRAIMQSRGLDRVVEAGPGVEGVDITDELVSMIPEAQRPDQ